MTQRSAERSFATCRPKSSRNFRRRWPIALFLAWGGASAAKQGGPGDAVLLAPALLVVVSILVLVTALKMKRLEAYWLAVVASALVIAISPANLIGLPIGIWALVVLSQREVRTAFKQRCRERAATRGGGAPSARLAVKFLCVAIGVAVLAATIVFGPGQYRDYRFRRSFVAEMMRRLPPTHVESSGPLRDVEILDLVHSKYGAQGDRYVVQYKIVYDGLRTTGTCELVGDRWGRYCGEFGGNAGYPRIQIFVGNWGTDSLPSSGGKAAVSVGFGPVIERTLEENGSPRAIDFASGKELNSRVITRVSAAEAYASFRDWMQENGMDAIGQTDELSRGLAGVDMVVMPMRNTSWDNPSIAGLWEALAGGTPAWPASMTVAGSPPATFGFATRAGSTGILQIVGFGDRPKGVNIRYRLVQSPAARPAADGRQADSDQP